MISGARTFCADQLCVTSNRCCGSNTVYVLSFEICLQLIITTSAPLACEQFLQWRKAWVDKPVRSNVGKPFWVKRPFILSENFSDVSEHLSSANTVKEKDLVIILLSGLSVAGPRKGNPTPLLLEKSGAPLIHAPYARKQGGGIRDLSQGQ